MATKNKRVLVQCSTLVNKDAIIRKNIGGVEHIVISSKTLPDNIVMNGGLYPAEEIAASFETLEETPAPVEHPQNSDGIFISATSPAAINNFWVGAHNENVRQENGRIHIDKVINVQEALKTDRGKRLLDRVSELETSETPRPIHTSVGVFIDIEETDGPQTNAMGQEFTWIARDMVFDHDAILLDSIGAAQPSQGVGMAVNAEGLELEVQQIDLDDGIVDGPMVTVPTTDITEMSFDDIKEKVFEALNTPPLSANFIADRGLFASRVIYGLGDQFFTVPYEVGNGVVSITGVPVPVELDVSYTPTTNENIGNAMSSTVKELVLNDLADAKIETEGLDDAQQLAEYVKLQANQSNSESDDAGKDEATIADVVANAIKPLTEEIAGLKADLKKNETDEKSKYAEVVGNSDKYAGMDSAAALLLPMDTLKGMAAN